MSVVSSISVIHKLILTTLVLTRYEGHLRISDNESISQKELVESELF